MGTGSSSTRRLSAVVSSLTVRIFTIGVQLTNADVVAGGPNSVLFVNDVIFTGGANGPKHALGAGNQPDVQGVQSNFINASAIGNGGHLTPSRFQYQCL